MVILRRLCVVVVTTALLASIGTSAAYATPPARSATVQLPSEVQGSSAQIIRWEQSALTHRAAARLTVTDGVHVMTLSKAYAARSLVVSEATASVPGNIRVSPTCFLCISFAWHVAKCAAVLTANAFVAYKLIKGLKAGLSINEFAKLLVQGTFAKEKLLAIAGSVTGISTIISACL